MEGVDFININYLQNLIKKYMPNHLHNISKYNTAQLYYQNKNDILRKVRPYENSPLRSADNRISHNWHNILVNQKASYLFTYPPTFDFKDDKLSRKVNDILGDDFPSVCKDIAIEASNKGSAWLHLWLCDDTLKFAPIATEEIIPIYSSDISASLSSVIRTYLLSDDISEFRVYEYWDDKQVFAISERKNVFEHYDIFNAGAKPTNTIYHNFNAVPFIEFKNNKNRTSDLDNVKALIDVYDNIYSGFVNDIEDIQQVIFILTNYGGADLDTFLSDLKRYKTVDMQKSSSSDASGLSTLSIDIPVAARNDLLKITRKQIFVSGGGVDPFNENIGVASGVSLKYLYSLLELKAGLMETEFRRSFNLLLKCILNYLNIHTNPRATQSYSRLSVQNDLEKAQMIRDLSSWTSLETITQNNPLVDDFTRELEYMKGKKEDG